MAEVPCKVWKFTVGPMFVQQCSEMIPTFAIAPTALNIQLGQAAFQLAKGNCTGHTGRIVCGGLWSSSETGENPFSASP